MYGLRIGGEDDGDTWLPEDEDEATGVYCPGGMLTGGGFARTVRNGNFGEVDGDTGLELEVLGGVWSGVGACWKDTRLADLLSQSSVNLLS